MVAKRLDADAIALTSRPACRPCIIRSHQRVTNIKLGGKENTMSEPERKEGEMVPVEPPKTAEEILESIRQQITEYPMPKTKAWGDMTDSEKFQSCVLFFKNKGYPYPYPQPRKVKKEDGSEEWEFPQGFPEDFKKEFLALEAKCRELQEELEKVKNELLDKEVKEVERLTGEVKKIAPDVDVEAYLSEVECPKEKRRMLERFKAQLEKLAPRFKIEGVAKLSEQERLDKIAKEAFGMTYRDLLASIGEEVKEE